MSGEDPVYPREAIKAGVAKGHVVVRLQIDEKGNVIDIKLVTADPPRVFSDANPDLHLNLDGARLAASAFVTHRPSVVIRRHRLVRITLDDLVGLDTVSPLLASFLAAAVKARLSIVVSGQQGDGKTTLLRALCAEIGPEEVLGTFETERELGLEQLADEHPVVFSWEARPGSGERGPDGRPVNEFTLQDGMHASFRYALDRQIVGEVRGPEVAQMIMAMESGSGSLSTTHAATASATGRSGCNTSSASAHTARTNTRSRSHEEPPAQRDAAARLPGRLCPLDPPGAQVVRCALLLAVDEVPAHRGRALGAYCVALSYQPCA